MNCSIAETSERVIKQIVPTWSPTIYRFAVLMTKKSRWNLSATVWISAHRAKWGDKRGDPIASNGCYRARNGEVQTVTELYR